MPPISAAFLKPYVCGSPPHPQKDCDEYRAFVKAAVAMGDSIRIAECFNMTVRDAYELPKRRANLVMYRDFDESRAARGG